MSDSPNFFIKAQSKLELIAFHDSIFLLFDNIYEAGLSGEMAKAMVKDAASASGSRLDLTIDVLYKEWKLAKGIKNEP